MIPERDLEPDEVRVEHDKECYYCGGSEEIVCEPGELVDLVDSLSMADNQTEMLREWVESNRKGSNLGTVKCPKCYEPEL